MRAQEKRIRAQQSMKQLSKRMTEQRLRTLEHLRAGMTPGKVRILPRDVEQGLKEFASGVEQLVDRLVGSLVLPVVQQSALSWNALTWPSRIEAAFLEV